MMSLLPLVQIHFSLEEKFNFSCWTPEGQHHPPDAWGTAPPTTGLQTFSSKEEKSFVYFVICLHKHPNRQPLHVHKNTQAQIYM